MRFEADGIDAGIRSATARHFAKHVEMTVDLAVVDRIRAGLTRRELERLGNYEDAGVLSDILNGQWSLCYDLMRACFDPAQVEKLFLDTLK